MLRRRSRSRSSKTPRSRFLRQSKALCPVIPRAPCARALRSLPKRACPLGGPWLLCRVGLEALVLAMLTHQRMLPGRSCVRVRRRHVWKRAERRSCPPFRSRPACTTAMSPSHCRPRLACRRNRNTRRSTMRRRTEVWRNLALQPLQCRPLSRFRSRRLNSSRSPSHPLLPRLTCLKPKLPPFPLIVLLRRTRRLRTSHPVPLRWTAFSAWRFCAPRHRNARGAARRRGPPDAVRRE